MRGLEQPRLADPGLTFNQDRAAVPGAGRRDGVLEHRQLGLPLEQHIHNDQSPTALVRRATVPGAVQGDRPSSATAAAARLGT